MVLNQLVHMYLIANELPVTWAIICVKLTRDAIDIRIFHTARLVGGHELKTGPTCGRRSHGVSCDVRRALRSGTYICFHEERRGNTASR